MWTNVYLVYTTVLLQSSATMPIALVGSWSAFTLHPVLTHREDTHVNVTLGLRVMALLAKVKFASSSGGRYILCVVFAIGYRY